MLASDVTLGGLHYPFEISIALYTRDLGLLIDLGAHGPCPLGQRHGHVHRRYMAVRRVPKRPDETVHIGERPEIPDLVDTDQVAFDADGFRRALIVAVLVHAVAVARQAQIAVDVQTDRLSGLVFQRLVKFHGVLVELSDRIAHVEQRQ